MKDDAQKALEELEQGLLGNEDEDISLDELLLKADELTGQAPTRKEPTENTEKPSVSGDDPLQDEALRALLAEEPQSAQEPAFEDPDAITDLDKDYQNFSNGYGKEQTAETEAGISQSDKLEIGLMFAISALALGVTGILGYWLATLLAHF